MHLKGYQNTTLDDVLRASGVGKGNFYHYFKSKEDLGYAILDRIIAALPGTGPRAVLRRRRGAAAGADPLLPRRVRDAQTQRNCVGGCAFGNLAAELSDVHEGFRARLSGVFSGGTSA